MLVVKKRTQNGELRFSHGFGSVGCYLTYSKFAVHKFVKANFWIVQAQRAIDWFCGTNAINITIGQKQKKLGYFWWSLL
jgi:hypothetical protein